MTGCKSYRLDSIQSYWESEVQWHNKAVGANVVKDNNNKGPLDEVALKLGEHPPPFLNKPHKTGKQNQQAY